MVLRGEKKQLKTSCNKSFLIVEADKKTVDAIAPRPPSSTPQAPPPLNKEESRDATAAGSPSLEPESRASKSPSFLSDSPSDAGSFTTAYYHRKSRLAASEQQPKEIIDYSKPENNVAVKYFIKHQAKIRQWRNYTLETLVNQQDCAVEAVKLETLLKIDIESNKRAKKKSKPVNKYELETIEDKRRLYNLLKY